MHQKGRFLVSMSNQLSYEFPVLKVDFLCLSMRDRFGARQGLFECSLRDHQLYLYLKLLVVKWEFLRVLVMSTSSACLYRAECRCPSSKSPRSSTGSRVGTTESTVGEEVVRKPAASDKSAASEGSESESVVLKSAEASIRFPRNIISYNISCYLSRAKNS